MAAFSTGLYYAGTSVGYIYLMMGCVVSSAVLPAILTVMWIKQNWISVAASPALGLICRVMYF
jgi:Na+/proline symporter